MNNPPVKVTPVIGIRAFDFGGTAGSFTTFKDVDAQVVTIEQRPGAMNDVCVIRMPQKRVQYFDGSDSTHTFSHFDQVVVSMGGTTQVFGTARNWIRRWQGNDEQVEFTVINQDGFNNAACTTKHSGRWNDAGNVNFANTKSSLPSARIIFNENGNPNFNKCETAFSDSHTEPNAGNRFWGDLSPYDTTAGWWNPINQFLGAMNAAGITGGPSYTNLVSTFGATASTGGGWSGTTSGTTLTHQKPFPEMDIDGMPWAEAEEKILRDNGGFQFYLKPDATTKSQGDMRIFRTIPLPTTERITSPIA